MANWQPTASLATLQARATFLRTIREFFFQRAVLEVEVPLLAQHGVTDPYNENFSVPFFKETYYLQTSPEYHLKRLLAHGMADCYQLGKAFRYEQSGKHHNPEFTILEWYRLNWSYHQLIDEVIELIHTTVGKLIVRKYNYQTLFNTFCAIDPLHSTLDELHIFARTNNIGIATDTNLTKDDLLNLIMSFYIEPQMPLDEIIVVYDYPKSQASLAIQDGEIAKRFEIYLNGIELANGFEELTDHQQQQDRFNKDNLQRKNCEQTIKDIDYYFMNALKQGLPQCSGVALGVDRLLMSKLGLNHIKQVMSFSVENA